MALIIICDRENEIDAFIPEEYWTMDAVLDVEGEKNPVPAYAGDERFECHCGRERLLCRHIKLRRSL